MSLVKWVKWHIIVLISMVTQRTTVKFLGKSYLVSGNIVKLLG